MFFRGVKKRRITAISNTFFVRRDSSFALSKKKYIVSILIILILLSIFLGVFLFSKSDYFKIKSFEITSDEDRCMLADQIKSYLSSKNYNYFSNIDIVDDLKKKNICIDNINTTKIWPSKLKVDVISRKPVFIVFSQPESTVSAMLKNLEATPSTGAADLDFKIDTKFSGSKYILDRMGIIFGLLDNQSGLYSVGYVGKDLQLGSTVSLEKVSDITKVINKLKELSIKIESMKLDGNNLLIDGDIKIVFLVGRNSYSNNPIDIQLASLQLILQKAKMNSSGFSNEKRGFKDILSIDLRYDKPVVVYSQNRR